MTDAKRLLAEAAVETPLGDWWTNGFAVFDNIGQPVADIEDSPPNAALIVYAVNHLLDYLAAVEAAQSVLDEWDTFGPTGTQNTLDTHKRLRAALARLRDEVPA